MQRRPWILVVALLILALFFSLMVAVRYLNRSDRLRKTILSAMANVPGEVGLGHASIESSTLNLKNIRYQSPDGAIEVEVDRLTVSFTITDWITEKGGLERLVESATIVRPSIVFRPWLRSPAQKEDTAAGLPDLGRFSEIQRIILRDGQFRLKSRSGEDWLHLRQVEAALLGGVEDSVQYQVSAAAWEDTAGVVELQGMASLARLTTRATLDVKQLRLGLVELPRASHVELQEGHLSSSALLSLDSTGLGLTARMSVGSGRLQVRNGPQLSEVELGGRFEDSLATFQGDLLMEGDPAAVDARLALGPSGGFIAHATVPEGDIGKQLGRMAGLKEGERPEGTVRAEAEFGWSRDKADWWLKGEAEADSLQSPVGTFADVQLDISWDHALDALSFDSLAAGWKGLDVDARARFQPFREESFVVRVDVGGRVSPAGLPVWAQPLKRKTVDFGLDFVYEGGEGWSIEGDGVVFDRGRPDRAEVEAQWGGDGYSLDLVLLHPANPDAHLTVWKQGGGPVQGVVIQPQLLAGWWSPRYRLPTRLQKVGSRLSFTVYDRRITSSLLLDDPATDLQLRLDGTMFNGAGEVRAGQYSYTVSRHAAFVGNGSLSVQYGQGLLDISDFSFMDYLQAEGRIDLQQAEFQSLDILLRDLDFGDLVTSATALEPGIVGGAVNGHVLLQGPFRKPEVDAHVELFQGRYGELKNYWGLLTLATDANGDLFVRQGSLGRGGETLLLLEGTYTMAEDELDVALFMPGSDANVLARALTGQDSLVTGQMSLSGRITGSLQQPHWKAALRMQEARLMGVPFDSVDLALHGESTPRSGHVLYVDSFIMEQPQRYRLEMYGAAPLDKGAGKITLELNGALLDIFPHLTDFIESGRGTGSLTWTITMVAGQPNISRGSAKLSNGSLQFGDLFPEMRNIEVDLSVDDDGRLLIDTLAAEVGEEGRFMVRNRFDGAADQNRQPILLEAFNLNLGVIELRTAGEAGVPVHIPGISVRNDFAHVHLSGGEDEEWFSLSGPTDSLLVKGRVRVARARVTYPPQKDDDERPTLSGARTGNGPDQARGERKSLFLSLLQKARLQLEFLAGRDVNYELVVRGLKNAPIAETFWLDEIFGQLNVDIAIEPTPPDRPLRTRGQIGDDSFRIVGEIVSTRGDIEFLDLNFDLQRAELVWDQTSILPVVSARAVTSVVDPQTQFGEQIYLTLYVIDPVTGERQSRGRWGEFTFVLEDNQGSSQEEVLSALGYDLEKLSDVESLQSRATQIGAGGIDRAITRKWLRPIERDVARLLGLDLVRLDPTVARNFLGSILGTEETLTEDVRQDLTATNSPATYLRASRFTLGKYLTRDLFVSYTGQLGNDPKFATYEELQTGRLGLLQTWSLEYRFSELVSPNLMLQADWEYDTVAETENKDPNNRSLKLKYTFVYDATEVRWRRILPW